MKNETEAQVLRKIFSQNLKLYMQKNEETISDISARLSVPFSTVSDWVHGRKYPRMDKVQLLADHFGVLKSDLTEEKPNTVSSDGLDAAKLDFIEKLKTMDSDTVEALNKLADSIIAKRNK